MNLKKICSFSLIGLLLTSTVFFTGCFKKKAPTAKKAIIELTYYKLFDNADVFAPLIQEFESQYKNIKINYRKFTDADEYENLIINELAEGQGPDIFEIQNTWIPKHRKKITPMPADFLTPKTFRDTFVQVASDDFIQLDDAGQEQIYGLPLTVDTLALYYNKDILEDKIPSRGKPGATWEEIKEDVYKINKTDNSNEKFEISGIAMGRADNIQRATDILYLLFLQNKTEFYDEKLAHAIFSDQNLFDTLGQRVSPAKEALDLYTSFALPSYKHYSWNTYLAPAQSQEKEVETFLRGKTAMIIGYSYLYDNFKKLIKTYDDNNLSHINLKNIDVNFIPQMSDIEQGQPRVTYANYFGQTVSRTSKHPREAWKFLQFLASKKSQEHYHQKTKKPTSRRDLIEDQKKEPIYGVFASQIGFAKSILMVDSQKYQEIFKKAINHVINTGTVTEALNTAQNEINALIPEKGVITPKTQEPAPEPKTPAKKKK